MTLSLVRLSVRLSVTLCTVAKRYILQQKCPNKWIGSVPLGTRFYNFQPLSPQTPSWKFGNFILFTISRFLDNVTFCLCCYEHGRVLPLRWWLTDASYTVRSAVSATAGLVFLPVVLNVAGVIQRLHRRLHLKLTHSNLNMHRNMRHLSVIKPVTKH